MKSRPARLSAGADVTRRITPRRIIAAPQTNDRAVCIRSADFLPPLPPLAPVKARRHFPSHSCPAAPHFARVYARSNTAECHHRSPFLALSSSVRPLECAGVARRILKNRRRLGRSEEALPVAAVLAVGGGRPQRGAAMHATVRRTVAQGLLAEKRLASRDRRRRRRRFLRLRGKQPQRGARDQLCAVCRRASAPRGGRIETSRELFLRRGEPRREESQRAGGAHGVR